MAVTFSNSTTTRTTALQADYPENIMIVAELNGRAENTDIEALARDIYQNGQDTPVKCRKDDKGRPTLVYGHRRWRAVKYINEKLLQPGQEKFKLEFNYDNLNEQEAFLAAIRENRFRNDVTDVDHSHNIAILRKRWKMSAEQVAAIYFPEALSKDAKATAIKWVKDRDGLAELADEAQEAIRKGEMKITAASHLKHLSKDQQRKALQDGKSTLKGKTRIKVKDVIRAKVVSRPATEKRKKVVSIDPKIQRILDAAELLARAVDVWLEDATDKAEKNLIDAHNNYRKAVPFRQLEGKAA